MITIECTIKEINEGFQLIVDNNFTIKVRNSNKENKTIVPTKKQKDTLNIQMLKQYFSEKQNGDTISRTDLRALNLVKQYDFAKWIDKAMQDVIKDLGFVYKHQGVGNSNGWIIKK